MLNDTISKFGYLYVNNSVLWPNSNKCPR